ncbi:hypothetical protein CCAX7_31480 [Capsulimonas corticalis]|uniref:Thioredoxin-like fold domain-containing protein n=1 Tax=Capsulimonas corticalis TaxID=2219043 RepID=A0A402CSF4_9BACT|nr:thioredoxin domain-containing protein [Capsulimonas corticalis]BDI31097.1 hypothetical protein CCAX7_31480 [Capsulimonas corticalis]
MPNVNKKTILFGSWIVLLAGLSFAVSRMSSTVAPPDQKPPPPPKLDVAALAKRWPEIMQHTAGPARGPASPAYTMVEFGDFQCPQCGKMRPTIEKTLADSKGQANLYFVHRPFPQMHQYALPAAQASEAAAKDGKFWPMYDVLYSHQDDLEPGYYDDYAKEAGLDGKKVLNAVQQHVYSAQVAADSKFCDDIGIQMTPTVFIRDNKTGKISIASGAVDINKMFAGAPWKSVAGPTSVTASAPAAPPAKS